jgi:hypothetical protein
MPDPFERFRLPDMTATSIRWLLKQLEKELDLTRSNPEQTLHLGEDQIIVLRGLLGKYANAYVDRLAKMTTHKVPKIKSGRTMDVRELSSMTLRGRYGVAVRDGKHQLAEQIKTELERRGWSAPNPRSQLGEYPTEKLKDGSLKSLLSKARKMDDNDKIAKYQAEIQRRRQAQHQA